MYIYNIHKCTYNRIKYIFKLQNVIYSHGMITYNIHTIIINLTYALCEKRKTNQEYFFRGKLLLGYCDSELANMGGYDLVHYDDLAYVASAHQERK